MPSKLTDAAIRTLAVPPKTMTIWDEGLGLRITPNGVRTFIILIGSGKRRAIGRYPTISLKDARAIATKLKAERVLGRHYVETHRLADTLEGFYQTHLPTLAESTARETKRTLTRHLEPIGGKLEDITARKLLQVIDPLPPSQANHTYRYMRSFFNWCVARQMLPHSPMQGMKQPHREIARERVLTDTEIAHIWTHTNFYPFGFYIRFLILTGARRAEAGELLWKDVTEDTVTFRDTKNGRDHTIPIGSLTRELLKKMPRVCPYVFPDRSQKSHIKGYDANKAIFDGKHKMDRWTLHDLRRTYATTHQKIGTPIEVTEKLLNHISGKISGITSVYQRYEYRDEMKHATDKHDLHTRTIVDTLNVSR